MVLELDVNGRASLEMLMGWRGKDNRNLVAQSAATEHASVPRYTGTGLTLDELIEGRVCVLFGKDVKSASNEREQHSKQPRVTVTAISPTREETPPDVFKFTAPRAQLQLPFRPRPSGSPVSSLKRPRHGLDVDGPNTAALCCKKRRLRAKLITSRLSQPYSQPATHILNREGQKQGDKRFKKMATSIDVARRHMHPQSTSFLRFSLMNQVRRRYGLGLPSKQEDGDVADDDEELDTTAKAPWKSPSLQLALAAKQARTARASQVSVSPPSGLVSHPRIIPPPARASKLAALPLPPSDVAATKARASTRIHQPVRSPELRPDRGSHDDWEEDGFAFLHGDEDALNDVTDDPDHVYSDFGVIFGGGGSSNSEDQTRDENSTYEEYLDELDGISWVAI